MRKYQKALTILFSCGMLMLFLASSESLSQDDITADFDESLDILSRTGEKITVDMLSVKNFRCIETITIDEYDKKNKMARQQMCSSLYEVTRKFKPKTTEHIGFAESRTSRFADAQRPDFNSFPLLERPFTGEILKTFAIEHRISNDFRKLREETMEGRKCLAFGFETVKEISTLTILLQGTTLSLRQQGILWIDEKGEEIVRLWGKLKKMPKGMSSYEYQIQFRPRRLFGRSVALPELIEIKTESKGKKTQIVQRYSDFQEM